MVGVSYIIWKVFENTFRSRFSLSVCTTIFKRIAELCFYPKSLMLYINGFVSRSSIILWKAFFKFQISFRIIGRKPKKNSNELPGVNIDQSAMCYIYQWIWLDELYKPMKSFFFFQFSESFFELITFFSDSKIVLFAIAEIWITWALNVIRSPSQQKSMDLNKKY